MLDHFLVCYIEATHLISHQRNLLAAFSHLLFLFLLLLFETEACFVFHKSLTETCQKFNVFTSFSQKYGSNLEKHAIHILNCKLIIG